MKIADRLVAGAIYVVARLPFGVLYVISDIIAFFLRHIIRYRRKVIMKNLRLSFPDKDEKELKGILSEFYSNFADYIVETLKLAHVSDEEMRGRMVFSNMETVDRLFSENRSIVAYFSHTINWEWVPSITLSSVYGDDPDTVFAQVYRPLKSKAMDEMMLRLRSRFGSVSFTKKNVLRDILTLRREGKRSITGFMSDQKPSHGDTVHVVEFMHQPTAVITGTAKLASRLGMAVVYFDLRKVSRGHYHVDVRLVTDDASAMTVAELTDTYVRMLEETIRRQPAIWLWSHNRWKIPVTYEQEELVKSGK